MLHNTILTPAGSGAATPGVAALGASGPSLRNTRCAAICQVNTVSVHSDTVGPGADASAKIAFFSFALQRRRRNTFRGANALLSLTSVELVSSDLLTPPLMPPSTISSRRPTSDGYRATAGRPFDPPDRDSSGSLAIEHLSGAEAQSRQADRLQAGLRPGAGRRAALEGDAPAAQCRAATSYCLNPWRPQAKLKLLKSIQIYQTRHSR